MRFGITRTNNEPIIKINLLIWPCKILLPLSTTNEGLRDEQGCTSPGETNRQIGSMMKILF